MSYPTIYIGCGGTGLKVLRELCDLVSEDPSLRREGRKELFFVLVDTEAAELKKSSDYLRGKIPGMDDKHIRKIHITQDDTKLAESISRTILGRGEALSEEQYARLKDHWWFYENRKPFLAERVKDLSAGAGQCPPVSYFSAWSRFGEITKELQDLLEYIKRVRQGARPLDKLAVQIITGLAGGTGRGCWPLLALEIQDTLEDKHSEMATVSGIFFDASITLDKQREQQSLINATRVNALTGFSELSYWATVAEHPETPYCLPSLERPEDESADEIHIKRLGSVKPVESAFLIFDDPGSSAPLSSPEEFYQMAARGLYCSAKYYQINGELLNRGSYFQSFGATAAQVPIARIRAYLEGLLRVTYCEKLAEGGQSAGSGASGSKLLRELKLDNLSPSTTDWSWIFPAPLPAMENLWQASVRHLVSREEAPGGILHSLKESLHKQNLARSEESVQAIRGMSISEATARCAVEAALEDIRDQASVELPELASMDPISFLRWRVQREAQSFLFGSSSWPSLAGMIEFGSLLAERVTGPAGVIGKLPKNMDGAPQLKATPDELERTFHKAKGRSLGIIGAPFNSGEIEEVTALARQSLIVHGYAPLREAISSVLSECLSTGQMADAEKYIAAIRETRALLAGDLEKNFSGTALSEIHASVFVDPDAPEKSLPKSLDATIHFILREIKPHVTRQEVEAILLEQIERQHEFSQELNTWIFETLSAGNPQPEAFKLELYQRMKTSLRVSHQLEEQYFTLAKVLPRIRDDWEQRFNRLNLSQDEYRLVEDRFERFFGSRPALEADNKYHLPNMSPSRLGDFVCNFIESLVHSCSPFWRKNKAKQDSMRMHYSVYMPDFQKSGIPGYDFDDSQWKRKIESDHCRVELIEGGGSDRGKNPFIICSMASEAADTLDDIESLSYWQDGGVINLLEMAENPGHENLIFQTVDNGINGVTYSSPIFVNNPAYRIRWRPWHKEQAEK